MTAHPVRRLLDLDRVVHEPARLAILTVLSAAAEVEFKFLEAVTGLTKGNLSSHTLKLEHAGYIQVRKAFRGRIPVTRFEITVSGRRALDQYVTQLKANLPTPSD